MFWALMTRKTRLKGMDRVYGIDENIEVYDAIGHEIQRIAPPLSEFGLPQIFDIDGKRFGLIFISKVVDSFRSISNNVYVRGEKGNRQLTAHEVVRFALRKRI